MEHNHAEIANELYECQKQIKALQDEKRVILGEFVVEENWVEDLQRDIKAVTERAEAAEAKLKSNQEWNVNIVCQLNEAVARIERLTDLLHKIKLEAIHGRGIEPRNYQQEIHGKSSI